MRKYLRPNRRQIYIGWHTPNAYKSLNDQICSTHNVAYTTKEAQKSYDTEPRPTQFTLVVSDPNAIDGREQVSQHVCQQPEGRAERYPNRAQMPKQLFYVGRKEVVPGCDMYGSICHRRAPKGHAHDERLRAPQKSCVWPVDSVGLHEFINAGAGLSRW